MPVTLQGDLCHSPGSAHSRMAPRHALPQRIYISKPYVTFFLRLSRSSRTQGNDHEVSDRSPTWQRRASVLALDDADSKLLRSAGRLPRWSPVFHARLCWRQTREVPCFLLVEQFRRAQARMSCRGRFRHSCDNRQYGLAFPDLARAGRHRPGRVLWFARGQRSTIQEEASIRNELVLPRRVPPAAAVEPCV